MEEKKNKRISKGKHQRRRKTASLPPQLTVRTSRAFAEGGRYSAGPLRAEAPDGTSAEASVHNEGDENEEPRPPQASPSRRGFAEGASLADASIDFGGFTAIHRPLNIEMPGFMGSSMMGEEGLMEQEGRPDSRPNENSFLLDSILKINRSHDSRADRSNSVFNPLRSRFIRSTSGRHSSESIRILEGLDPPAPPLYVPEPVGGGENLNASLLATLPPQLDFSYDTVPFGERLRHDNLFAQIPDVHGLPSRQTSQRADAPKPSEV